MSLVRSCTKLLELCNTFLQKICSNAKKFRAVALANSFFHLIITRQRSLARTRAVFNTKKLSCHQKIARTVAGIVSQNRIAIAPTALMSPGKPSLTLATRLVQPSRPWCAIQRVSPATPRARRAAEYESDRSHTISPRLKLSALFASPPSRPVVRSSFALIAVHRSARDCCAEKTRVETIEIVVRRAAPGSQLEGA